jgi:hypothetical protein
MSVQVDGSLAGSRQCGREFGIRAWKKGVSQARRPQIVHCSSADVYLIEHYCSKSVVSRPNIINTGAEVAAAL